MTGMHMQPILIYSTFPSAQEAKTVASALLEDRLIACANISAPVTSLYRWEGKLEQNEEVVLIAKTRVTLAEAAAGRIKALHSYQCPCVVILPILGGYTPFLEWLAAETLDKPPK